MYVTPRELAFLQERLNRLLGDGFVNVKALEREAGLTNGTVNRLRAANPETWAGHATTKHDIVKTLDHAVDRLLASVNKASNNDT